MSATNGNGAGAGEQALARIGFDGERLMGLAHKVAQDWLRGRNGTLQNRYEDLVSFLVIQGLRAALTYDPERVHHGYGANGGDPAGCYLADIMEQRCVDFYRSKAEGFGDSRYGLNDRLVLSTMEDDPDPDVDFESLISEKRLVRWQQAAERTAMSLPELVCFVMDDFATQSERAAA